MRKILWNSLARFDYYENIDFLMNKWSDKEAQEFIDDVNNLILILEKGKVEFQDTDYPNVKRCVVCKQVSLFYRVIDKHSIELLRFWNNYKDNKTLNL